MRYFITASDDTTLYQAYPAINAGFDEILEIGKLQDVELYGTFYTASSVRSIISFNLAQSSSWDATSSYFLNLRLANAKEVDKGQRILIGAVSQSWREGSGYFYQEPENRLDGATWTQATPSVSWSMAGGTLNTVTTASVELTHFPLGDLRVDVTSIIQPFVSQSLPFYGLYLKFPDADEASSLNSGKLSYFSTQTHTIYQPTLEIVWDDQVFLTGSLVPVGDLTNIHISATTMKAEYQRGSIGKVRLSVRDKYPTRNFDGIQRYGNKYHLPVDTSYRIVDNQSNAIIGDFGTYNRLHCDGTSSYMLVDTSYLYVNREYRVELKIETSEITEYVRLSSKFLVI